MPRIRILIGLMGAFAGVHACGPSSKTSGETHWLGECDRDADCIGAGQCLCGVCTRVCGGDGDCGGPRPAQCFETTSPGLASRCGKEPPGAGICLGVCASDSDCARGSACLRGACVAALSSDDGGASTTPSHDGAPSSGQIATSYVHVDAGLGGIDDPIVAPTPRPLLDGADDGWLGQWAEYLSDGTRCTPDHHAVQRDACRQLDVTKDESSGGYIAEVTAVPVSDLSLGTIAAPFAPATDPDRGYPPGISPADYINLASGGYSGGRLRAYEGHITGDHLSFWTSDIQLWAGWCALQKSYPFQSPHLHGYRCVPQDATYRNTDVGKLILCTTMEDYVDSNQQGAGICTKLDDGGVTTPCADVMAVCACSTTGCDANLRAFTTAYSLDRSGTVLRGADPDAFIEFRMVSP